MWPVRERRREAATRRRAAPARCSATRSPASSSSGALPAGTARRARPSRARAAPARVCLAGHEPLCAAYRRERARAGRVLRAHGRLAGARRARRAAAARPRQRPRRLVRRAARAACCAASRGCPGDARRGRAPARSACSPPRRCARAARTCACSSPIRRARGAPPSSASSRPRPASSFAGALLSAAAALADALPLLEPGGQLVLFSGGATPAARHRPRLPPRARACAACARRRPRHLREALELIASGAVECESLVDCVLGARRVRRRPRALPAPPGAQGGVRAVIAARFWAPRDVRVEHVAEPEPRRRRGRAPHRGGADLRHRRQVLPPRPSRAARAARPRRSGTSTPASWSRCGEDAPFSEGDLVVRRQLGALRRVPRLRGRARGAVHRSLSAAQRRLRGDAAACPRASRASNLHRVPEGVSPEVAAAIEPLACAVHGADDARRRARPAHRDPRPRAARAPARAAPARRAARPPSCSARRGRRRAATRP